jgi:site-specific DNA-methyltransferase (adenine-specific)
MTIELVNGDCLQYMATLEDNSFDLAVVDPPYGMKSLGAQKGGVGLFKNRVFHHGAIDHWDISPSVKYFNELCRVSVNQIVWGGQYFTDKLSVSREWITWDKCQPWETFSQVELAWTSFKGTTKLFKYDNRYSGKIHPTQKPVALYQWIFDKYAKKGMKILDTHLGSGSSAIAAHDSGLDFVGIELDADYFQAAKERLETHQQQLRLFT